MLVTPLGIVMLVSPLQPENAPSPMLVTPSWIVMLVRLLRAQLEHGVTTPGLLAGLSDTRLSRAIVAIHDRPGRLWINEDLAGIARLSVSRFVEVFRDKVGETPMSYLRRWRMILARQDVARGDRIQTVADRYGYASGEALSRAFRRQHDASPSDIRRTALG